MEKWFIVLFFKNIGKNSFQRYFNLLFNVIIRVYGQLFFYCIDWIFCIITQFCTEILFYYHIRNSITDMLRNGIISLFHFLSHFYMCLFYFIFVFFSTGLILLILIWIITLSFIVYLFKIFLLFFRDNIHIIF